MFAVLQDKNKKNHHQGDIALMYYQIGTVFPVFCAISNVPHVCREPGHRLCLFWFMSTSVSR